MTGDTQLEGDQSGHLLFLGSKATGPRIENPARSAGSPVSFMEAVLGCPPAVQSGSDAPLVVHLCVGARARQRNQKGRLGKLHVKCAVVDEVAVIGSANLTDDAFNRNMELAVSLSDPISVRTIKAHFMSLILEGILKALPEGETVDGELFRH